MITNFKTISLALVSALMASSAFAEVKQVSLSAYTDRDSYASSAFNFEKMSQDPEVTGNRFHILYQPNNMISTETVVGDFGAIADLGGTSCKSLSTEHETKGDYPGKGHGGYPYKEDRVQDPMFWLTYSKAWSALRNSRNAEISAYIGHCYLVHLTGHDGITIAMFHIKDLVPGKMLLIDEIEVFQRAQFSKN